MTTLAEIELKAKRYSDARGHVADIVSALKEAMDALKKTELPKLRRAVAKAAEAHDDLKALVESAPELFAKPKTQTLHGIRLGYMKGKGKMEFDDPDTVVKLIKRYFPELADALIVTTERPAREALAGLDAAKLKKLGITITETGEAVFIKPVDAEIDKFVDSLLSAATEEPA